MCENLVSLVMKLLRKAFNLEIYEEIVNLSVEPSIAINYNEIIKMISGKWYLVVECEFIKDDIKSRVGFRNKARIDKDLETAISEIQNNFNNFVTKGSG